VAVATDAARSGRGWAVSQVVLVRHGETAWSQTGQHTGVTELPLTEIGERQVAWIRPLLAGRTFGQILTSPREHARATATLLGWGQAETDSDLAEWDYGAYEGRTTAEISTALGRPWRIWTDPLPAGDTPGETLAQVAARADRVLARISPVLRAGHDVALVAHSHILRVLTARWLGAAPGLGAVLALSAGGVCELGQEHDDPVILSWNFSVSGGLSTANLPNLGNS